MSQRTGGFRRSQRGDLPQGVIGHGLTKRQFREVLWRANRELAVGGKPPAYPHVPSAHQLAKRQGSGPSTPSYPPPHSCPSPSATKPYVPTAHQISKRSNHSGTQSPVVTPVATPKVTPKVTPVVTSSSPFPPTPQSRSAALAQLTQGKRLDLSLRVCVSIGENEVKRAVMVTPTSHDATAQPMSPLVLSEEQETTASPFGSVQPTKKGSVSATGTPKKGSVSAIGTELAALQQAVEAPPPVAAEEYNTTQGLRAPDDWGSDSEPDERTRRDPSPPPEDFYRYSSSSESDGEDRPKRANPPKIATKKEKKHFHTASTSDERTSHYDIKPEAKPEPDKEGSRSAFKNILHKARTGMQNLWSAPDDGIGLRPPKSLVSKPGRSDANNWRSQA